MQQLFAGPTVSASVRAYLDLREQVPRERASVIRRLERGDGISDFHYFAELDPAGALRATTTAWTALSEEERTQVAGKTRYEVLAEPLPESIRRRIRNGATLAWFSADADIKLAMEAWETERLSYQRRVA